MINPVEIRTTLKELGVSTKIVVVLVAIGVGYFMYRNYKEMKLITLQTKKLNQDLYGIEPGKPDKANS